MKDSSKTKKLLIEELAELRARLASLDSSLRDASGHLSDILRLFEQSSHGFLATDRRGAMLGSNAALRLMLGCRVDQQIPKWTDEDVVEEILPALEKAEQLGAVQTTISFRAADLTLQSMDCRIAAVYGGGQLSNALWTVMPLASPPERKAAGDEYLAAFDLEGAFTFVSPSLQEILGRSEKQLLGRSLLELVLPADRPEVLVILGRFARAAMLRSPGDTQKLPQAQLALTFMALGGGYVRTFAEFSLAGERLSLVIRHMGAAPHQSIFSEMSEAMDKAKSGMVVLHGAKVVYASAAARGILGHPLDELPMAAFAEIAAPSALPKALGLIKDFELTGRRQDFDLWVKRPGGAARQLSFRHIALGRIVGEDRIALMIDECCDERADEHRRLLETLLGNLPGCAYRCRNDSEWTMSFVSEGCELLTGYRPEDLLDSRRISYNHIIHPEDRQGVWDDIQQALAEDRRFDISYRIIRADGAERQVRETGCGVTGADSLRHIEGFIMDVTEREEAVAALRRGEERLRTIIQGAPDMIFIKGRDHRYLLANPAACEENGLPEDRIVGHTDAEVWGDDVARKLADEDRLVFSGQTHRGERTIPGPRGPRTLSHVKVPLKDSDGNVASICSFVRNVTDQTRVAAELRESEARYRALVEASPDAFFLCDAAGTLLEVNDAAASLYGFERTADLVGRGIFEFVADAGADSFNDFDWSAGIDRWFIRKDGSRFFGEMRFATLRDGRILGINRDVTCRLKRQFELDRLKRAMDQSAEGLLVMEPDSTVSYVNAAFCRITGLAAEEVLGRRGDLIREALGLPISPRVFEKLSRGEAVRLMTTGTRRTGETWRAEEIVNPILDDAGGIIGFFSVLVDKDFAR